MIIKNNVFVCLWADFNATQFVRSSFVPANNAKLCRVRANLLRMRKFIRGSDIQEQHLIKNF